MTAPKLFVSYSWTSTDHEEWVLQLSTDLRESGVDVILDKWDLREGHDAHAFMEKMVTDPDIKKVVLVCDKAYVDKTNGRSGGVGTEAQIISGEIYEKQDQSKFVAIVTERDEHGKVYLPAYYRSRIYIDFSDPSASSESFDRLLRWVYDKPVHKKPDLGNTPSFLVDPEGSVILATTPRFKRAMDAIRNNRDHALPAVKEYLDTLVRDLERFRIQPNTQPFDEQVVQSVESFLPYRNEAIDMFLTLGLYRDTLDMRMMLHRFFEALIPYLSRPQNVSSWAEYDFDNFRFIIHELFLYGIACFIKLECFETAAYLLDNDYYIPGNSDYGRDVMLPFPVFCQNTESLEHRNRRLGLRHLSVRAKLLEERCKGLAVEMRHLMQADFTLFLRDRLSNEQELVQWWPETLLYLGHNPGPFEVFVRSRSAAYFERAKLLLGIQNKDSLVTLLNAFSTGQQHIPRWQYHSFNPSFLLAFKEIATRP